MAHGLLFLSPAPGGRMILVAPGFRQASCVTFFCGRKPPDANKIQNGRQRSTPIFLWAQKLLNLMSENIQILLSHSPAYRDV